jgi:hypothetical protein
MINGLTVGYSFDVETEAEKKYMAILRDDNFRRLVGFYHSESARGRN